MLRRLRSTWLLPILAFAIGMICIGCTSGATQRERMQSVNAFDRADAAVKSARAGDKQAVHTLVGLLEDRDAGVRLYAINALERLCGTTMGYRYYAAEPERDDAVRRWRDALRDGKVVMMQDARIRSESSPEAVRSANDIAAEGKGAQNAPGNSQPTEQGSGK